MSSQVFQTRPIEGRIPMSDPELEALVTGYLLGHPAEAAGWMSRLGSDCFFDHRYRDIYGLMEGLVAEGLPSDTIHVVQAAIQQRRDSELTPYLLVTLQNGGDALLEVESMVQTLRQLRARRKLQALSHLILLGAEDITQPLHTTMETVMKELMCIDIGYTNRCKPLHDVAQEARQRLTDNQSDRTRHHGPYTGLRQIDEQGGLPESGLVVIAGGTSQGKSALGALIALRSADQGMKSAYFSMELSNVSTVSRMVAMHGEDGISSTDILRHRLEADRFQKALQNVDGLDQRYGEMIFFDDTRSTQLSDICSAIRTLVTTQGIRLAIVDYLQLLNYTMQANLRSTTTEMLMGQASRTLKNLGDQLGICVVVLCQINRSLANMRPQLSAIRDSGQIAEAADMVIFGWRPEAYNGTYDRQLSEYQAEGTIAILVSKNREGPLMEFVARWDGPRTLVSDYEAPAPGRRRSPEELQTQITFGDPFTP